MHTLHVPCPACAHQIAAPFFDGGHQPLATIAWPESSAAAEAMPKLPLDFVRCMGCGHVFNRAFEYALVPYGDKPNRMFNLGGIWNDHLSATRQLALSGLPDQPTVVEIGCGSGHFLRSMAAAKPGRYIGFDPNAEIDAADGAIVARRELFIPDTHLAALRPDLIVMRHMLEHLKNPLALLQDISLHCRIAGLDARVFIEVPCIDRVFDSGRLADFYFEHHSHFTRHSFKAMLTAGGFDISVLATGYDDEVVYALAGASADTAGGPALLRETAQFHAAAKRSQHTIGAQLDALAAAGKRVAIWGGTGKGAAFIHHYGADRARFALVVDSDPLKVGTFVPGAGQEIQSRDVLRAQPVDVVIIPTQWRARDIVAEMRREHIETATVLIEHGGELVDFFTASHPYQIG